MHEQIASKMMARQFQRNKGILQVIMLSSSIVARSEIGHAVASMY